MEMHVDVTVCTCVGSLSSRFFSFFLHEKKLSWIAVPAAGLHGPRDMSVDRPEGGRAPGGRWAKSWKKKGPIFACALPLSQRRGSWDLPKDVAVNGSDGDWQ